MFNPKIEINNPEALKLIADIKSGAIFIPAKNWVIKYKWFLISGLVLFVLLISLAIGRAISGRRQIPIFLPPDISTPVPTTIVTTKSDYQWIKDNIINYGTELPDPVIPAFDNSINLESANI